MQGHGIQNPGIFTQSLSMDTSLVGWEQPQIRQGSKPCLGVGLGVLGKWWNTSPPLSDARMEVGAEFQQV